MLRVTVLCLLVALSSAQFGRGRFRTQRRQFQQFQPLAPPEPQPQPQQFVSQPVLRQQHYEIIPIVRLDSRGPEGGVYSFEFESGNGIVREESGSPDGPNGAVTSRGSWRHALPDGTQAEFSFVADENGYQVNSPLLPQPPPVPAHVLELIAKAERERAEGIVHDGQWHPERYGGGQYATRSVVQPVRQFVSNRRFGK